VAGVLKNFDKQRKKVKEESTKEGRIEGRKGRDMEEVDRSNPVNYQLISVLH
jgi:hypothetical protein